MIIFDLGGTGRWQIKTVGNGFITKDPTNTPKDL